MSSLSTLARSRKPLGLVAWVGKSVVDCLGYVGGVAILLLRVVGWLIWPWQSASSRGRAEVLQVALAPALLDAVDGNSHWSALVHIAIGSFLSLQAYYGSTFVDGTGAVVGVGLLRNLGGIMSGMTFSGILAARMIPELRRSEPPHVDRRDARPSIVRQDRAERSRETADALATARRSTRTWEAWSRPRIAAAAIACILLTLWGITVGIVVGWKASESLMGLSTEMFFMMMLKMMWFRDVLGLVVKGILFGALAGGDLLLRGAEPIARAKTTGPAEHGGIRLCTGLRRRASVPVFRAACLSMVAILVMNSSWFMLVYHAVPFYGPTLLPQP